MAHDLQTRYSDMVLAKLRKELVLKDGVVFNTDYEGTAIAGAVKIPVRDTEVAVTDYDKANGISATAGATSYVTMTIGKDKAVNEIIDGYDAQAVPDNLVADRLDSAGYSLAAQEDTDLDGALEKVLEDFPQFKKGYEKEDNNKDWGARQGSKPPSTDGVMEAFKKRNPDLKL